MGTATESLNTKLGCDTTDFKTGVYAANRELRVLESSFRASVSTLGDWANSISGVELRQKSLTEQMDLQKLKVAALREEHQRLVDAHGKTSTSAKNAELDFNKENERLGKMQTELAGTVTGLKNLKDGNDAAGRSTKELQDKQEPLSQQFKKSWTEINSMIGVAKEAWQLLKGAVDQTVGEFVNYANQVRELNQLNGQTAEKNSRLIQLTDDYKISVADLMTTQKELLKDGKLLSTETLADIADKYNAATTQVDKNKIASDSLGKSWKSYIELLQKGSTAIRDEAAAISGNLILTEASLVKARDFEKATDALGDSFMGLKVAVGEKVAPALTDYMNQLTKNTSATEAYARAQELGIKVSGGFYAGNFKINGQLATQDDLILAVATAEKALAAATKDAALSMDGATQSTDMFGYAIADGVDGLKQANAEFGFIVSFAQQYETNLKNVQTAENALKSAQADLFAMSKPGWDGTSDQIKAAFLTVDRLKGKLSEAQQASQDATTEMIAGFLQAQLAADGTFSEEDIQKVLNYRLTMGLMTKEAYKAALAALAIAQNLAGIPKSVDGAAASVDDLSDSVDGMADSMDTATQSTDMFGYSIAEGVDGLQQANAEFGFIIGFAKQYETNLKNVATAEDNLKQAEADLFAMSLPGWKGTAAQLQTAQEKVDGLKTKLDEAKEASRLAAEEMISGFLQAQLTADGSFTEEDIQKVLDYRKKVGLLTEEAYNAAQNALAIANNLAGIPKTVNSEVTVHTSYTFSGRSNEPGPAPAPPPTPQALGGDYLVRRPTLFLAGEAGPERATFTPLNSGMNNAVRQLEAAVRNLTGGQVNPAYAGGSSNGQQTEAPITITIQATVQNETDIYKLSRRVAEEIKRNR